MRLLLKIFAVIIFGPLILGVILVTAVAAIIAVPIVWEEVITRFTSPPDPNQGRT